MSLLLSVKLSFNEASKKNDASIVDINGDLMLVPQASIGGKLKGKVIQYHANVAKDEGAELYHALVRTLKRSVTGERIPVEEGGEGSGAADGAGGIRRFAYGTYGNQQVLDMTSAGPFTHIIEI